MSPKTDCGVRTPVPFLPSLPSSSTVKLFNTLFLSWVSQLRGPSWPLPKSLPQLPSQLMLWTASLTMPRWPALGSTSGELQVYHSTPIIDFETMLTIYRWLLCYLLPNSMGRKVRSCRHVWGSRCYCWSLHILRHRDPDLWQEMEGQSRTPCGRKLIGPIGLCLRTNTSLSLFWLVEGVD
jgi:hypothetical protein